MWFTYILFCDQKTYYVGITKHVQKRLAEHKLGKSRFTKQFSDIMLVYSEAHITKKAAERRERQIKGWSKAKKKALVAGDKDKLVELSRSSEFVEG